MSSSQERSIHRPSLRTTQCTCSLRAAAMGYRLDDVVGVFGVTTVASARRRGYGTAVTRAAMLTDTGLPAVLAPSEEAANMYLQLGFEPVGALSIWSIADQ